MVMCQLSAADEATLAELSLGAPLGPAPPADSGGSHPPGPAPAGPPVQTYIRTLDSLGGEFMLTKVPGPEPGTALVTGLPLAMVDSTLEHVENTEHAVFATVLLLAVVLGAGLIQVSLRPLRRVAATATRVTELPLDSGEVTLPAGVPDTDQRTEVGRVGAAFNRMLFHVEKALGRRAASEARLRRFAADASHELRTPLSAIRGYAELALRHPGPVPEDVTHALRRVQSESARMTVLVDDLLLLARLDAGAAARARAGGPVPAGHRDDERRAGGPRRPPLAAGPAGRAGHGARRRAPPASGDGQPAEQRGQAHPGGFDGQRRARPQR